MSAAESLGGTVDVCDAVHGSSRGARGGGHENRQVWHLRQVDDSCWENHVGKGKEYKETIRRGEVVEQCPQLVYMPRHCNLYSLS